MDDPPIAARGWTAQERESFFAAIARHRRAAWQVSLVSGACILVLAIMVALLMSPLFYAVIGLALDMLNILIPAPDLIGIVMKNVGELVDSPQAAPPGRWLYITAMAAVPGLFAMSLPLLALHRIVREAETSDVQGLAGRAPDGGVLAEQRFANVVQEMALAAGTAAPRTLVIDSPTENAGVFGEDEKRATAIVSTGLLTRLGDAFTDRDAFRNFLGLLRKALRTGASAADAQLVLELINPFGSAGAPAGGTAKAGAKPGWRDWLMMPLTGPLVMSGFLGGLVSSFLLEPLLALAWRRRKYMADAIAVQLTRDPDGLAGALAKLGGRSGAFSALTAHMCVVPGAMRGGVLSGSTVSIYPSADKRLLALGRMGARVSVSRHPMPLLAWFVVLPLGALIAMLLGGVVYLLVVVSVALSGLFTWLPAILLHALLR